jgi:lipopolysaccharide transport protein LptA
MAAGTAAEGDTDVGKAGRIRIAADQLVVDREANTAEFLRHVTVRRADGRLTADRVVIHYRNAPQGVPGESRSGEIRSGIEKMIAEGRVRIETPDMIAEAERAVYSRRRQTIVLTGPEPRIRSGNNSVAGSTITLYIDEEKILVLGDAKTRVEAILTPGRQD